MINDQDERLIDLGETVGISVHAWHGGISASRKRRTREDPSGILIITPESLEALFVLRGAVGRAVP